jgi:hypothetical protein
MVYDEGVVVDSMPGGPMGNSPTPTWAGPEPSADRAVNKPSERESLPEDLPPAPELSEGELPARPVPPSNRENAADDDMLAAPPQPSDAENDDLFDTPAEQPAAGEDDLFSAPTDQPADTEPAMEQAPSDDLFGAPAEETPAEEPTANEDLFGAPAEEPATEPPAEDSEDLFGAPEEEPAASDDLFGSPADEAATEPAAEEPPAEEPAAAEDDLFGVPAETPAADESAEEDLFGAPAEEPSADAPADDVFGAPAADEEDLFGAPAEEPAADEPPADEAADDLFGDTGSVLQLPGGLSSLSLRHWVDNTGSYTVDARLVAVIDGHVRLLKANGRTTTVALSRLSDHDLSFVNRQAAAQQARALSQTAQR